MPPGFVFKGMSARDRTGKEAIGLGLYGFGPGNQLWPYPFHVGNEEWAIIVSGTPTLRTPENACSAATLSFTGRRRVARLEGATPRRSNPSSSPETEYGL